MSETGEQKHQHQNPVEDRAWSISRKRIDYSKSIPPKPKQDKEDKKNGKESNT